VRSSSLSGLLPNHAFCFSVQRASWKKYFFIAFSIETFEKVSFCNYGYLFSYNSTSVIFKAEMSIASRRIFVGNSIKIHELQPEVIVRKSNTRGLGDTYRLIAMVSLKNNDSRETLTNYSTFPVMGQRLVFNNDESH
jgi:hypothetical protein